MSGFDRSLADIVKSRKWPTKRLGAGGAVSFKAKPPRLQAMKKKATFPRGDAREKILQKRNLRKMTDAREKLSRVGQVTDARQKLNAQKSQRQRVSTAAAAAKALKGPSEQLRLRLTRTINNKVNPFVLGKPGSPASGRTSAKIGEKQVLLTKGGLTVIRKSAVNANFKAAALPASSSSLFARTVNSLAKEVKQFGELQPPNSAAAAMKWNVDSSNSLKRAASSHGVTPLKKARVASVEAEPSTLSPGLQLRLGGGGGDSGKSQESYRIAVSNLHPNVTLEDIMELFGDVGPLRKVELTKQGTAEVIFAKFADAKKALETYHDRELDGQPMKCKFANLQAAVPEPATYGNVRGGGGGTLHSDRLTATPSSSVRARITPDIGVIHKALFSRTSSQLPPHSKASITVTM